MAREFARAFYNSARWKKCKKSYIAERVRIDGGMCETCHRELGKIVHHTVWLNEDNINDDNVALNHSLLRYDCQTCHNQEKENEEAGYVRFDSSGQPMPPYQEGSSFPDDDRSGRFRFHAGRARRGVGKDGKKCK